MQAAPNMGLKVMADITGAKKPLASLNQESDDMRKIVSLKQSELSIEEKARPDSE